MTGLIKATTECLSKGWVQGMIAFILVLSLCYMVTFGGQADAYKDLFGYAVSTGMGFYFGRETKSAGV